MPSQPAIDAAAITDGLDRQNLALLRKRFLQVNADRLHRTRMALNHQQDLFLCGLPLLFHCNHPMLPGYVSHSTPAGISGFKPSKTDVSYGKAIARSFCLTGGYHQEDIWAIFLMGSVGTLAQSSHSDFDVWLCHRPDLSAEALRELEQKCQRISQWAKTLRLDAHFFLMNCEAFKAGSEQVLDAESSGSAQRLLLLDEFYRTALHVAGRVPLWWFIPSDQEAQYEARARELLDKRFLRPGTTLDFGPVHPIPDGEFIGASIWQMYKAIQSPYKSVLKLLLLEAYAHDYPNITPLSLDYKQCLYNGEEHIDALDPYVLIYQRIERYLMEEGDSARLELARRCLYFKVHKPLSKAPSRQGRSWQRLLLEQLVHGWGWTQDYLRLLDLRPHWKTLQVKEERNQLVQALNHSYEMLLDFAQRSGAARSISSDELNQLGRKLQAAFGRRPDKLEWLNPGISKDISEGALIFIEARTIEDDSRRETAVWQLFSPGDTPASERSLLKQSDSPVELLFWCYVNRVIDGHVRLDVSQAPHTNESQLYRVLNRLQQWLPLPLAAPRHAAFTRAAQPTQVLMLINVAAETPSPLGGQAVHRLSNNSDPLSYGGFKENLVASVDVVTRNSWQELSCQRFEGKLALLQALQAYVSLCMPGSHQAPPHLDIDCLGLTHAALISQRTRQWFHEIVACYYTSGKPPTSRYLFTLGGRHYSLQFRNAKLVVLAHKNLQQLQHYLGEAQKRYSPIVVDSQTLHQHPIKYIAKRTSERALHVFFHRHPQQMDIYVVDERGSLVQFASDYTPRLNALTSLHVFLRAILLRTRRPLDTGADFGVQPVEFHELREDHFHRLALIPRVVTPDISQLHVLQLAAIARCNNLGQFEYDFVCEQQHFSWDQLKQDVFYATAQYILSRRHSDERYPVYITDLNLDACSEQLSSDGDLQITHYLRIKIALEQKLSAALMALE